MSAKLHKNGNAHIEFLRLDVVDRMNAAIKKALEAADVKTFMEREALEPIASSPEGLTTKFNNDSARYAKVIKAAGINVQ